MKTDKPPIQLHYPEAANRLADMVDCLLECIYNAPSYRFQPVEDAKHDLAVLEIAGLYRRPTEDAEWRGREKVNGEIVTVDLGNGADIQITQILEKPGAIK